MLLNRMTERGRMTMRQGRREFNWDSCAANRVSFCLPGLLWNLSSVDSLKPDLLKSALPVLMERVILPYTTGPDRTDSRDHEVFYHTTGCLRSDLSVWRCGIRELLKLTADRDT